MVRDLPSSEASIPCSQHEISPLDYSNTWFGAMLNNSIEPIAINFLSMYAGVVKDDEQGRNYQGQPALLVDSRAHDDEGNVRGCNLIRFIPTLSLQ